jgi:ferredoxin
MVIGNHRYWTNAAPRPNMRGDHGHKGNRPDVAPSETHMPKFNVLIEDTGEHYPCSDARSLLEGMLALDRKAIPQGCRNGGCGICKVQILSGEFVSRVMSRAHVSEDDERQGRVLACRVRPASDIRLAVVGGMKKRVCQPSP